MSGEINACKLFFVISLLQVQQKRKSLLISTSLTLKNKLKKMSNYFKGIWKFKQKSVLRKLKFGVFSYKLNFISIRITFKDNRS